MKRLVLTIAPILMLFFFPLAFASLVFAQDSRPVEDVEIRGNRSIPTDTIKLYIQTKKGDPYSEVQLQRDFQAVMAQGFFDEFDSRVFVEEGPRGGVIAIFYVKERPIIRDITYEGLKSVQESDVIQRLRERRVPVSKESRFDPVAVEQAKRVLKELLAEKGKPNAQVDDQVEDISATTVAINFVINEGPRVRITKIDFEGNTVFSDRKLRKAMKLVKQAGFFTIFSSKDIYDKRKLDEDLQRVRLFMGEKGYIRPTIGEPVLENVGRVRTGLPIPIPLLSKVGEGVEVKVPIDEGRRYNFGKISVQGNSLFTEEIIIAITGMKTGEVASSKVIREGVFERLRKLYGRSGYIQAVTDLSQSFNDADSTVDFTINIEEGKPFRIRRIEFKGNTITRDTVLRREILVNEGDLYNSELFDLSRLRLNQLGYFEEVKEEDAQLSTDDRNGEVDITLQVKEKGRQQISFTGGVSGIGGSFIGITYSTNNLFGYGEALSLDIQAGNRQRNFSISFTEPYLRGRPISAGISVFTSKLKFFSGGLTTDVLANAGVNTSGSQFDSSLFTRDTTGFSLSLSAPLTYFTKNKYLKYARFTRIGLSYSFSSSKVTDPEVNRDADNTNDIFVSFRQPNITTSTITPTLVYNTLNSPIDPTRGQSLTLSFSFSGLGGDVKLFAPSAEFKFFRPVARRGTDKPQVVGMRLLVETVRSFGDFNDTNSLSFIGGIPIFNRFFLGGEDSLRGYNVRSISPVSLINRLYTTTNVSAVDLATGRTLKVLKPGKRVRGVDGDTLNSFIFNNKNIDVPGFPQFTPIGGDTQVIYNFEYRIPLAGPLSMALFADAGTTFNTASLDDQALVTPLPRAALVQDPGNPFIFQTSTFVLNPRGRIATPEQIQKARTPETPLNALPKGFRFVTFQGDPTTTSQVRLSQDLGSLRQNFRSSIGAEFRVQVPVVGVPFRLIFAYNPNAKTNRNDPSQIFLEQKKVVRFSIGRTF